MLKIEFSAKEIASQLSMEQIKEVERVKSEQIAEEAYEASKALNEAQKRHQEATEARIATVETVKQENVNLKPLATVLGKSDKAFTSKYAETFMPNI